MSNINPYIHDFTVDLRNGVTMERAKKPLSQGDAFANKIVVHVLKDGQTVPLDGVAVSASVIRYDGATVPLTGTVEEGAACIVLNDECYAVPGDLLVSVVLAVGEVKQTILRLMLNVETSQTDIIADGGVIGSFSQLLAEIENMRSATAAAISAAERAEAAADKAEGIAPGGGGTGTVTSVNGVEPDEEGNVQITIPEVPAWAMAATKPAYTAKEVGADPAGTASSAVSTHNADEEAHPAIRQLISDLSGRLSALADSDDTTLDQLSEIVAYIKSNKSLIDSITTGKVSTADIVNNLTSTATNKPLSAAQGKALKALIDAIVVPTKTSELTNDSGYLTQHQDISHLLPRTELEAAVDTALAEAKASGAFDGEDGEDGHTPVKGVDYYTEADKAEFSEYIASELAKRGQLKPEFANSIEECTDTSKLYVLPDGYIYAYIQTVTEGETVPNFTNLMDDSGAYIKEGYRYSSSSAAFKEQATDCSIVVPVPITETGYPVIRVRGAGNDAKYNNYTYYGTTNTAFPTVKGYNRVVESNGDIVITATASIPPGMYVVFSVAAGVNKDELIVTVNEEITYTTTESGVEYKWASTGHAFVPADYEDRIIAVESKAASNTAKITALENKPAAGGEVVMYISPTGDDADDGLSASTPKKTVKACVDAGATRISAKRGVYREAIRLLDIGHLEIIPTDNDKTYVAGETRQPIVFDTSDSVEISALTAYNSIKRVAYSNANAAYDAVFVQQTLAPTVSASQSSYHAALWLFSDDEKTVRRKPKPVLTIAECEAETNTFCYADGYIYINADMTGVTKIIVPTITTSGFYVNGADKLVLNDVEVRFSGEYTYDLRECAWVDLYKCSSKFTTRASGFHPVDTNGIFRACYATKCFDGFAPNGHGHTTYIDCVSEYNYDDGMSHHAASEGTVIGGRYEGNGKAGNIPAYGAKVNIYGGLYKGNAQWGICYAGDGAGNFASGMVQGAVMVDNPVGLEVQTECLVTALDCHYTGNTKDKNVNGGTLTEY